MRKRKKPGRRLVCEPLEERQLLATLTQLTNPVGLTFDASGQLYVASSDNAIFRYDSTGAPDAVDGQTGATFVPNGVAATPAAPTDEVVGPDGMLYVANSFTNRITVYNATTGAFVTTVAGTDNGISNPQGIAIGPDGRLYVANAGTGSILRFDLSTYHLVGAFVAGGLATSPQSPQRITFGPTGDLFVSSFASDQILRYNGTTGAFKGTFVAANSGSLDGPTGLAFGPDGNLYVASFNNNRILQFNGTNGAFIKTFVASGSGASPAGPQDLVFTPGGDLIVSSSRTSNLLRYNGQTGASLGTFNGAINPTTEYLRTLDQSIARWERQGTDFTNPYFSPDRLGIPLDQINQQYDYDFARAAAVEQSLAGVDRRTVLQAIFNRVVGDAQTDTDRELRMLDFMQRVSLHNPILQATDSDGATIQDPLVLLELAEMRCGQTSSIAVDIFRAAGYDGRLVQLGGHIAAELYYGGDWHYFDADLFGGGQIVRMADGHIPSIVELSHHPEMLDALLVGEPNLSNSTLAPQLYPSYFYFSRQAYSGLPVYFEKTATPAQEAATRSYGWQYYRYVVDNDRVLYDDMPLRFCPATPVLNDLAIADNGDGTRTITLSWLGATPVAVDPQNDEINVRSYKVYIGTVSRGWNYDDQSINLPNSFKSSSIGWQPMDYDAWFKIPAATQVFSVADTQATFTIANDRDFFVSVMPVDWYGSSIGKSRYALSEEIVLRAGVTNVQSSSGQNGLPTVNLTTTSHTLTENGGSTSVIAKLSQATNQDVTVRLKYTGTATNGADYNADTVIVIPAGQTSGSIVVTGLDDLMGEGSESIVIDIAGVENAVDNGNQSVTATILDDASDPFLLNNSTLTILGSDQDDVISIDFGFSRAIVTARIGNVAATIGASTIIIDGRGGNDRIVINTSNVADQVTMSGSSATIVSARYLITIDNVETKLIYGDSLDAAQLNDTSRNDIFQATSNYSSMSGTDQSYSNTVFGFGAVSAQATLGFDTAQLYGNAGNQTCHTTPTLVTMTGGGVAFTAGGFDQTYAYGGGGVDDALLDGSNGNDLFYGYSTYATFSGAGWFQSVAGFATVTANSNGGANDTAILRDSSGDDTFSGSPTTAILSGTGFANRVNNFDNVYANASTGHDTAVLTGSTGNDTFYGYETASYLLSSGVYLLRAMGFEVTADSGGGASDIAVLYDSAGDDTFVASPTSAKLSGADFSNLVRGFDYVYGCASGGNDTATLDGSDGDDTFYGSEPTSVLLSTGYFLQTFGFDLTQALLTSSQGNDVAYLWDGAGNDQFTGVDNQAYMQYGSGIKNHVWGFDAFVSQAGAGTDISQLYGNSSNQSYRGTSTGSILQGGGTAFYTYGFTQNYATGGGGTDAAVLDGTAGNETFYGLSTYSLLNGAGWFQYVIGFSQVTANGNGGAGDLAQLYDSAGNDTLIASPTSAQLTGVGFSNIAAGFASVSAYASSGNDAATLDGSTGNDTFSGYEALSILSGGGYRLQTTGFDLVSVLLSSGAGVDAATIYDSAGTGTSSTSGNLYQWAYGTGRVICVSGFDQVTLPSINSGRSRAR